MQAVTLLGYRPNANAQALATQVSDTIGVVVMDVSDAFFGALVKAVDLVAQQHQKYVLIGNSYHEAEKERHAIEVLIRQRCNALIVHSKALTDRELSDFMDQIPGMVLINRIVPGYAHRCVCLDNVSGARMATRMLLNNGHQRIGYLASSHRIEDDAMRREGWLHALQEQGVAASESWIGTGTPDMQVAEQRIQLAEAQAKAVEAQDGPQLDFSADIERQRMSAEGLMGPFAITDPAAGTTGPWYTNGTFGLTAGWDLDLWGKNRAEVTARIGAVKAREAEQEQTRQLLASGVARLYWEWQTQAALKNVLMQIEQEQQNVVTVNRELYQHGITSSVEGVETDIDASKTQQQLNDVNGKMKVIEARLSALTNTQSAALKLRQVSLPAVESQLPSQLGYSLLARRADLQAAHWYIESSLSSIDAAKAAFYPDINLMAFLQQDALHLSDLFRHSAQQYGITGGLTLPIFDSGRLNANLDIAKAQSNLSIANYNKAVVDAVNDVARAASQVETLAQKNQHQQQIEHDAQRVVGLAQARFNAGIIAGSRVSEAKIPALREQCNGLLLQGQWLDASIQLTSALGGGYHS
ncbi:multidrug resistance outer membrane protein MdtQ [Salmonella enterica]|nr:multidrug resistance outer membrane protein MdtQ [Salmonella enterica]